MAGSAAGIPDEGYLREKGITDVTYDQIISWFGPEQNDTEETEKVDKNFARKQLADWQYNYQVDLNTVASAVEITPSEGGDIAVGDTVVLSSFHRGTGQNLSGGASVPMYNRCSVPDYYTTEGIQTIIDY